MSVLFCFYACIILYFIIWSFLCLYYFIFYNLVFFMSVLFCFYVVVYLYYFIF
jgi:hypothetical protein